MQRDRADMKINKMGIHTLEIGLKIYLMEWGNRSMRMGMFLKDSSCMEVNLGMENIPIRTVASMKAHFIITSPMDTEK